MNTSKNSTPEAYIAVAGNRQKIYPGAKVYLKGGTEFQLELFNPTTGIVAAKIYINNELISNSLIVIKPGRREYLDRYIDEKRKFLFDTYEVEDSAEAKAAIAQNGIIKVEFFRASSPQVINTWNNLGYVYVPYVQYPPYVGPYYGTCPSTGPVFNCTSGVFNCTSGVTGNSGPVGASGSSCNYVNTGDISEFNSNSMGSMSSFSTTHEGSACMDNIETGRIEGGDVSKQEFTNYNGEFESYSFLAQEYQILPASAMPVEINKIRQYCPGCRNRIRKSTWQFCPSCGESLD